MYITQINLVPSDQVEYDIQYNIAVTKDKPILAVMIMEAPLLKNPFATEGRLFFEVYHFEMNINNNASTGKILQSHLCSVKYQNK